jgi:hypothetical protein
MAIFRLAHAIPRHELEVDFDDVPLDRKIALIDQLARRTISMNRRFLVEISKVEVIGRAKGADEGRRALRDVLMRYPEQAPGVTRYKRLSDAVDWVRDLLARQ